MVNLEPIWGIVEFFSKEGVVIAQALGTFCVWSVFLVALTHRVVQWYYRGRIATLEGQRDLYKDQLEHGGSQIRREDIRTLLEKSLVREVVTQLQDNAILLAFDPYPDTVRLLITSMTYVLQTSPSMVVHGRKILLDDPNKKGEIQMLSVVKDYIPERAVVVEYHRYFSTKELDELGQKR